MMATQVLIYIGEHADFPLPKLGLLRKDEPRFVTDADIAAIGGTTPEDFCVFVKGLYNRNGLENLESRAPTSDEVKALKDESDAVAAAQKKAAKQADSEAASSATTPPTSE